MKTRLSLIVAITTAVLSPMAATAQDMANMPGMSHTAVPTEGQGVGIVKAIDTAKGTITLQHEAIAAIHWPAMTMAFKMASPDMAKSVKVGDEVQFIVRPNGMDSTVTSIKTVQP